jgi:hypothetical protein
MARLGHFINKFYLAIFSEQVTQVTKHINTIASVV